MWSLMTVVAATVTGPIAAVLIATRFPPDLQGYYYAFGGLASLQVLADLGLGQAVIQLATHESAGLQIGRLGRVHGDEHALSRLVSLGRQTFRWYAWAGVILVPLLIAAGFAVLGNTGKTPPAAWIAPWISFCLAIGLNVVVMPAYLLLQGCGETGTYWFYRCVVQVISGVAVCLAVASGMGLWTQPLAAATVTAWSVLFLAARYRRFVRAFTSPARTAGYRWWEEVWPLQWRIAVVWGSTYVPTALFSPLLFRLADPIAAGQMGMTVSVMSVLLAAALALVVPSGPALGRLAAAGRFSELDSRFSKAAGASGALMASVIIVALGGIVVLGTLQHPLAQRVLSPMSMAILLAGGFLSLMTSVASVYLRAFKREPLARVVAAGTAFTALLAVILGAKDGARGVCVAYLCGKCLETGGMALVFRRCRREWTVMEALGQCSRSR